MKFDPKIFKAYDLRGVYQKDFDEGFAYQLGLAYGTMRKKETKRDDLQIVVGCDMRLSSPILKEYLIKGLSASGVKVIDIGLSSTPTFYFAVAHYHYDGGIMVSASHNPAEYNGFKITRERGQSVGKDNGLAELKKLVQEPLEKATSLGEVVVQENVVQEQVQHDLQFADLQKIKKFTIVIDPANAMGSEYLDELFKYVPAKIIRMNWELDGRFPAHQADPFQAKNVADLARRVVAEKADLGIATDGDGDRIFFVDNLGHPVEAGITRAILSKIFLQEKPGATIAYDIRPGRITRDIILANGGKPIITKVGHSLIKLKVLETNAYFAGESSGHFFLNMPEGCYEVPMIVVLKILQELSETNLQFSEYLKPYQKYYHSGEINSQVADPDAKILEIKQKYADGKQNELDGISVEYPDFWFNVRKSNTEPLLRLNLEAKTKIIMEEKRDELLQLIRS